MSKDSVIAKRLEEKESRVRVIERTRVFKEEMMQVFWHPDRAWYWLPMDDDY
jgi:hypothetical protein